MEKIRFIGDIHGMIDNYLEVIEDCDQSIQVGDFGIGFVENPVEEYFTDKHRFIRGNHDNPTLCKQQPNFIPDGTIDQISDKTVMFIGGALSIDRHYRVEGVSWWRDEECSYSEFDTMIQNYNEAKPDIMITHECPDIIANQICLARNKSKFDDTSITRNAFDTMFLNHKPKLWIFGHWHVEYDVNILGTRFVCLNELSTLDIDVSGDLMDGEVKSFWDYDQWTTK